MISGVQGVWRSQGLWLQGFGRGVERISEGRRAPAQALTAWHAASLLPVSSLLPPSSSLLPCSSLFAPSLLCSVLATPCPSRLHPI